MRDRRLQARARPVVERAPTAQQFVEQDAACPDVGGNADRAARQLLGRGVLHGHRTPAELRQLRGVDRFVVRLEQLCDPEVQQHCTAFAGDQHVAGLQVAMHDEMRVGVLHGLQYLQHQLDSRLCVQMPLLAPAVDRLALDVFEREIGLAVVGHAGVVKASDVGVRERRTDVALAREALHEISRRSEIIGSFTATCRFRWPSTRSASHTSPMPPRPRRRSNR